MAAAIPLAVGALASGTTYAMGYSAMTAMTVGMLAMTIAQMLLAPEMAPKQSSTTDYAVQEYTARADNESLPRVYGTVGVPANLVWFGNYHYRDTKKSQAESRVY